MYGRSSKGGNGGGGFYAVSPYQCTVAMIASGDKPSMRTARIWKAERIRAVENRFSCACSSAIVQSTIFLPSAGRAGSRNVV